MVRRMGSWSVAVALVVATLPGCSCEEDPEGEIGAEGDGRPAAFGDLRVHMDMIELAHLAEVDHHGTFIDFGTPARMKYTVGHWRTGWTSDESSGDATYSNVGITGRVFFNVDEPGPLTIRFRAKPVGSRNLSVFVNNNQQELVRLEEGDQFRDYDVQIPAEHVERGENYLLLRLGGTTRIGQHDVAMSIESIRIVGGAGIPEGDFHPPLWEGLVQEMNVGGATRKALAVHRPTVLTYYLQVPRGGRLGFGVGAEGDAPSRAHAKVFVTPEGGDAVQVYSGAVGAEWHDEVASLERWEGSVVRVDLRVEGQGEGRVGWSSAALLTPPPEEREPPRLAKNVVVLLVDTLRADKLRPYNPRTRVQTPIVDGLAERGAVFEQAQAPENWTKPSVASVLTGLYPATHGAKTSEARVPEAALLLSEHLKANGFATGSFIANGYVSDRFGFEQGWDHYTNYIRESKSTEAENVFGEAAAWIEQNRGERFFAYVQTIDPHVPYDPPAEYLRMYDGREYTGQVQPRQTADLLERAKRTPPQVTFDGSDRRRLEALHDGEISYHDHALGEFIEKLKELGVWEDTIFVLTSDHGEEFNDHGSWGHGHTVYQELLHVPLLFHMPGVVPAGARVRETVSTLDIAPTVLAAAHVPPMPDAEGRELEGFMLGEVPAGPTVAFSDFLDDRRVITAGRWKLILRGINATFFDVSADPTEQRELDRHDHPVAMRFCRIMLGQFLGASDRQRWMDADQSQPGTRFETENAQMDDTMRDQLRALGYAN